VLLTRSPLEHPQRGLSVRLACVKHAASVRPEPGSNSPNKNPHHKKGGQNSNQRNLTNKTTTTPHTRGVQGHGKKTTTKKQNHQTHY
jgi:hypothetical protein